MKDRLHLDDIAARLGVAKSTVSRAISGTGRISRETRERILAYVAETGYIPNASASNLSLSRTRNLAYSMPLDESSILSNFFLECLFGVSRAATAEGYNVIVVGDSLEELCRIAGSKKVDGLILSAFNLGDEAMRKLVNYRLSLVLTGSSSVPGVKVVSYDARSGFRQLTGYLLDNWKIPLGLILSEKEFPANLSRAEGFRDAMTARGEINPPICTDVRCREEKEQAMTDLYRQGVRGIICGDDAICTDLLAMLDVYHHEADGEKREMAETIRLASFHSNRLLQQFHPEIPTVVMNPEKLGEFAAKMAIRDIEKGDTPDSTMLDYSLHLP